MKTRGVTGTIGAALLSCVALAGATGAQPDLGPRPGFREAPMAEIELGQLLFYDPILSGNRNISCATCHHPKFGTSDGVSLSLGEGGIGLGPERRPDPANMPEQRIPRNAPALFNLGSAEFARMFHDGRLEVDSRQPDGIRTPLGEDMAHGFDSVLSAQAMFPVLAPDEMAGHYSENEVSRAVRRGQLSTEGGAWDLIAARVDAIPEYRERFDTVIGAAAPIHFTDIANAIAAFVAAEWRADDSAFDRAMAGEATMSAAAARGMDLFYGRAGCSTCHSGWFQTDQAFHAIAVPQLGPGKAARFETHARDEGRYRVTGDPSDLYRFRTPSLRNVTLTAPYGHDGAFATLEAMVRHHLDPGASLAAYDRKQVVLPSLPGAVDWRVLDDPQETAGIAEANELRPVTLSDGEISDLLAFLDSLTDLGWQTRGLGIPERVPSGLPVDR